MEQYISKSALVAELERLYDLEYDNTSNLSCGKKIILRDILLFLNTLEVKDVDFDIEVALWANAIPEMRLDDVERLAKYFYELGLNAKGE